MSGAHVSTFNCANCISRTMVDAFLIIVARTINLVPLYTFEQLTYFCVKGNLISKLLYLNFSRHLTV